MVFIYPWTKQRLLEMEEVTELLLVTKDPTGPRVLPEVKSSWRRLGADRYLALSYRETSDLILDGPVGTDL